jgi:hypothetical protein
MLCSPPSYPYVDKPQAHIKAIPRKHLHRGPPRRFITRECIERECR